MTAVAQHFLLTTKARTLSLAKVMRLTDEEADEPSSKSVGPTTAASHIAPSAALLEPTSKGLAQLQMPRVPLQVLGTSGTIFASRKLAVRDILAAIAIFVNGAKGHSALQLSRDLDCQYKTAFVLSHKLREALAAAEQE